MQNALRGFRNASSPERAGFGILGATAATIGASRAINYVRERRRPAPRIRSRVRRAYHAPRGNNLRVHHFLPGMVISTAAGATAILTKKDAYGFLLSLPFGVGVGLTLDEFALLIELDNPYWGNERIVLLQGGLAGVAAGVLGARFARRGAKRRPDPELAARALGAEPA